MKMAIQYEKLSDAEKLLFDLGIRQPGEIDLDAIALTRNVKVNYRPLVGCEAQIVGNKKKAIAIINQNSSPARQRFSLAHELGHWRYHKGRQLTCRTDGSGLAMNRQTKNYMHERVADEYASELLMPSYLFRPLAREFKKIDLNSARLLNNEFSASLTATLIKLIKSGLEPAMLICHSQGKREWFVSGPDIPSKWFPKDELEVNSEAFSVLYGNDRETRRALVEANAWYDRSEAYKYEVYEQSVRISDKEILTIVTFKDFGMIDCE